MGDIFEKYTPVPADEWRETKAELDRLRAALAAAERERDEARGQAIAAKAGWDACVSSRAMLQAEVDRMRRARDPDELESQRQANAILTDEVERLRALLAAPEREERP